MITNIHRESNLPLTHFGGLVYSSERSNFNRSEDWISIYIGEGITTKTGAMPTGNNHPIAWRLPLNAGAISSRFKLLGACSISANGTYGLPLLANLIGSGGISQALGSIGMAIYADLTGSGGISQALGGLLVELAAALSGSGEISNAEILAFLNAIADLTGTGEVTEADLLGLGELMAILEGDGIIEGTLLGNGELTADIKAYGELTPEGIRDAVWQAAALSFNDSGSMGELLNLAGTGGVNYNLLAQAVWAYATRELTEKAGIARNEQLDNFTFLMTDSTNHTPATGLSVTAYRSIDGGMFSLCTNLVSAVSNGIYKITLSASDLNGEVITLRFTATGADDRLITIITE